MKNKNIDMISGPLLPGIIRYTVPIILSSILQLLFNAADLMVVGQFSGSVCVGAVASTGAITNLIVNLFVGLSVGAGVSVAHALGGRRDEEVHRTVHTAIPVAIISGVILTVIGVSCSESLLRMMSTPEDVLPLAALYMQIFFGGITFALLYNYCASMLCAAGDTRSPLLFLTIAGALNVVLNVIFVVVLHRNVDGVAMATVISQAVSAILVVRALMRRTDACRLEFKKLHIYPRQLKKMIVIGLPAGIQGSMFSISNVIIQSSVNSFGSPIIVSGNGAASNIEGFVYASMNAFSQTAVNFIGQNLGAMQFDRIRKSFHKCLMCVAAVGLVLGPVGYLAGPYLLKFYVPDSPEAIHYALIRMNYICLPYFLCGLMDVATGALRGLGTSFIPMVVSILGICVLRIAWIYTVFQIPEYHTLDCLYFSYILSWVVTFAIQFTLFHVALRHKQAAMPPDNLPT